MNDERGPIWLSGAERQEKPDAGVMQGGEVVKMICHTTEGHSLQDAIDTINLKRGWYHLLWDPKTGRMVQFYPFNVAARSCENGGIAGGVGCNKAGRVAIQVCAVGFAKDDPWTTGPRKGLSRILALADSWGIPREFPAGARCNRNERIWLSESGWYGHGNAPGNSHTDPYLGGFNPNRLFSFSPQDNGSATPENPDAHKTDKRVVTRILKQGSTGSQVKYLQKLLKVKVDGEFGPTTTAHVKKFQRSKSLTSDGVVGAVTWKLLGAKYEKPKTADRVLRRGSKGGQVKKLQRLLKVPRPDGKFGDSTEKAVIAFQKSKNMKADGTVGKKTWKALGVKWIRPTSNLTKNANTRWPTDRKLLRKLNAVARDLGVTIHIVSGYRTYAEQKVLYARYIAYLNGGPYANLAAVPGTSLHETGNAADCSINGVDIGNFPGAREALRRHGLCLPVGGEPWHVQTGNNWNA